MITRVVQLLCAFSKPGEQVVYAATTCHSLQQVLLGKPPSRWALAFKNIVRELSLFPLLSHFHLQTDCRCQRNSHCGIVHTKLRLRTEQTHKPRSCGSWVLAWC